MTPWYCDEHGKVLNADWHGTPGIEFSVHHFCPLCGMELSRRDALSVLEGERASSFEEWKQGQAAPVLEFNARPEDGDPAP